MGRTKKTDKAQNGDKTAKNAALEPEALERAGDAAQEPETEGQAQEATQEPETEGQAQEATQEPEATGQAQGVPKEPENSNAKTSAEDAAKIEAAASGVKLEMSESGEFTITEPETDIFAKLPNPCVYCGPSVKGVARQYTTYHGGIPDALREFIKKHRLALGLIVSTENFPAMRKRLETYGTPEAKLYKYIKAKI